MSQQSVMIHGSVVTRCGRSVTERLGSRWSGPCPAPCCATVYALFFLAADLRLVSAASYGRLVPHSQSQKVNVEA